MKNSCKTCNAPHKNTVERVIRCMGCKYQYNGQPPTNYRPIEAKLKEKNT